MNTRKQILIDKYVAKPIAYLFNFVARFLGKILSIDHNLNKPFKRIVICKYKGLGSIIQSTPMLEALRKKHPNAEIIFVSTKSNEHFLKKIDTIHTIVSVDDKSLFRLLVTLTKAQFYLIKNRPDVYIDLEIYSNFSTLVALFSLSKNRIGFYLRDSSFKMGIYTHMMFFNPRVPISEVYLQVARLFGEINTPAQLYPIDKNISVKNDFLPQQKYIIINPNASDLRIERRWDALNFKMLIEQLLVHYKDYLLVLIGSKSEKEYTHSITQNIKSNRVINTAGETSIDELIALIKNADLVITNDTGPMHISFACKTPTVCLFGPCSPSQYGSAENASIIYKNVYCSPCVHDFNIPPCGGDNVCMKLIELDEVLVAVENQLKSSSKIANTQSIETKFTTNNKVMGLVNRTA
ncbi:MAG: glycosyltransferase family 9 protein [Bacteroidia bacterium]|nr:glycosyltransferase family 9 protein [Bacteroidia bacterium]